MEMKVAWLVDKRHMTIEIRKEGEGGGGVVRGGGGRVGLWLVSD